MLNKSYIMKFFAPENRVLGLGALGLAAILVIGGYASMNKLANIDV